MFFFRETSTARILAAAKERRCSVRRMFETPYVFQRPDVSARGEKRVSARRTRYAFQHKWILITVAIGELVGLTLT